MLDRTADVHRLVLETADAIGLNNSVTESGWIRSGGLIHYIGGLSEEDARKYTSQRLCREMDPPRESDFRGKAASVVFVGMPMD